MMDDTSGAAPPIAPLASGSTIGILGSGQLGRMLALAAARLGMRTHIYADRPGCAGDVATAQTIAPYDDATTLTAFAKRVDVVTYEFENVPAETAATIMHEAPLHPSVKALKTSQDRIVEKAFLRSLGIPVAPYAVLSAADDRGAPSRDCPGAAPAFPALLKTARFGYDGKGQIRVEDEAALADAHRELGRVACVLEERITFAREVSVIAVRATDGTVASYDVSENTHENQILKQSSVPADVPEQVRAQAASMAQRIASALDYVGTIGVEFFHCPDHADGPLLVNEIAPRVHNSGHWTLDACLCSQFENHIRAISGWPLGACSRHSDATMSNLIGPEIAAICDLSRDMSVTIHDYAKGEARPGRKMGHVTHVSPKTAR
ncbi:MAG: 5-(carboxyamino)imidazole ribonucleotide synthase [Pseudomonadota bacterium]